VLTSRDRCISKDTTPRLPATYPYSNATVVVFDNVPPIVERLAIDELARIWKEVIVS
jgi:hypothetical protein